MSLSFNDFQKQDIKFDITKLREACTKVLNLKGFDTSLGIPHFAGISLNQIPGDPESIKGNNVRGVFWTKPSSDGKEVSRDKMIDEGKYTQFIDEYKDTYFKTVYEELSKKYKPVMYSFFVFLIESNNFAMEYLKVASTSKRHTNHIDKALKICPE